MAEDKTAPRTLWTETLLEMLVSAIKRDNDIESKKVLREIRDKGYGKGDVIRFAHKNLEPGDAQKLERLIRSMGKSRQIASR